MAITTRPQALALYRSLLREASKFTEYNYRMYAWRKTRDSFRTNKNVTDPQQISNLLKDAKENLSIIKRQVVVGQLYGEGRLIIESRSSKFPLDRHQVPLVTAMNKRRNVCRLITDGHRSGQGVVTP